MDTLIYIIICFFVGILLYYLIRSNCRCHIVEGQNDEEYKYFYGYFGREEKEDMGESYPGITDPPYYILNNVDFADLKGELSFFKTEFIKDSLPYTTTSKDGTFIKGRKYGIQYIDKWLIKYKGELGGFQSMQDGAVTGSVVDDDISNGRYIGSGVQTGYVDSVGNKDGNWLSIYGECPNKTIGNKCKTQFCYNNTNNQIDDCTTINGNKITRQIELVNNINELKTKNQSNIYALYIGTIRLDDLNGSNVDTECYKNLSKIYSIPTPTSKPIKSDKDVPIWANLIDPSVDIINSNAYTLLNNDAVWGCKMKNNKEYRWEDTTIDISNIKNICGQNFISSGENCNPNTPSSTPSPKCPKNSAACNPKSKPPQNCPDGTRCPQSGCCPINKSTIKITQNETTQIESTQIETTQIETTQIETTQIETTQIEPTQIETTQIETT